MAYNSRVYRILIASPSDVEDEREIIVRIIQEWNDLYSYTRRVVLLPLRWETHAAPDYGTRPQEVINRAIVDECDLLVGVFWTRIGSPTGVADSGTLEEIERVGKAGKPIMLYFSSIEIDPDRIDTSQYERLKDFKRKSYPKGLLESYKKIVDFRDKFSRQLEIRVRELQNSEASGAAPISLGIMSLESESKITKDMTHVYDHFTVRNFDAAPGDKRNRLKELASAIAKEGSYFPVPLTLQNNGQTGLRNLFIQLEFSSTVHELDISTSPTTTITQNFRNNLVFYAAHTLLSDSDLNTGASQTIAKVKEKLSAFETNELHKDGKLWTMTIELDALQAQRVRLIEPVLYIYSPHSGVVHITAKVFADSFPEPFVLTSAVNIQATQRDVTLVDLIPNWEALLERDRNFTSTLNIALPRTKRSAAQKSSLSS